ncbi:MAG TPA: type I methionyl aminopeptidase [Rhizomicrobium sp.]|jgi:methionyl aminopeptidase|nr:type I methionyl aminopeptidase [Rhizomicrobium sp.]
MTIEREEQLEKLRLAGAAVARTLKAMIAAAEPGMTTKELDDFGRRLLDKEGARSAPESTYDFPGATCISISPAIAHGIPNGTVLKAGDLVNVDVSADIDGYFADTGGSFVIPPSTPKLDRLCRDGKRAMWAGINAVKSGVPLSDIGRAVEKFAKSGGYTLIRNLASHGVGASLHEEPGEIPTWYEKRDKRRIHDGLVFTIEPFLSLGSEWAEDSGDGWTLLADSKMPTVQYEHTMVATKRGAVILTQV